MILDLLQSSYFSLFLIVALGFMLGRIKVKGLSLDVSAVIFIALLFGHFGVVIPKELGNFGLVLFIFTIGIQAGPGFFDSFRSKGKALIVIALLIVGTGFFLPFFRILSNSYLPEQEMPHFCHTNSFICHIKKIEKFLAAHSCSYGHHTKNKACKPTGQRKKTIQPTVFC